MLPTTNNVERSSSTSESAINAKHSLNTQLANDTIHSPCYTEASQLGTTPPTHGHKLNYRPEIDGLRGVAILAVVVNHIDKRALPGGFVGVDVFFAISGYLITSILLREAAMGSLSLKSFYARRVRRLLPAAAVMSAIVTLIASALFLPQDFKELGASLIAYSGMASNVLFWRLDDYFAGQMRSWPLLHTWSLAVEEQFYLLFPLLVIVIAKRNRLTQYTVFSFLLFLSFSLSVWQSTEDPRSAYYLLPGRSWELIAGALCAVAPSRPILRDTARSWLCLGSLMCVLAPMLTISEKTTFPGWVAAVPVCGAAGLITLTQGSSSYWKRLLSARWLVWTGLISYSLYLWHWPLLTLARYPWSGMAGSFPKGLSYLVGLASLFVAWLSFRYVETPARRFRSSNSHALWSWATAGITTAACGLLMYCTSGFPQRLPPDVIKFSQGMTDVQSRRSDTINLSVRSIRAGAVPKLGCKDCNDRLDFILWGDSHADALVPAFDQAGVIHKASGVALTRAETPPLVGLGSDNVGPNWGFRDAAVSYIQKERPGCVVLAARWSRYMTRDWSAAGANTIIPERRRQSFTKAIHETIKMLKNADVQRVWILGEVPTQRFNVPKQLALHQLFGWQDVHPLTPLEFTTAGASFADLVQPFATDRVAYLDTASLLRQVSNDGLLVNGDCAYTDYHHISASAAIAIAQHLTPIFDE